MGVQWTEEQKKVITLRDRNILVSAAAGSGKTAVLVERILSMLMDPVHPIDIDRLLIMTFTRAAAGEMKERITKALEKVLLEQPENEHLQRQMNLVHTAQITTIDGFCSYIIRNYFHLIGLDPGYRVGDEGEMKLLREDVLNELLEEFYAKKDESFEHFVECYASGKNDDNIRGLVFQMYAAAMSHPTPEKWMEKCLQDYCIETGEELLETVWMHKMWENVESDLKEAMHLVGNAIKICLEADGPLLYETALQSDRLFLEELYSCVKQKDFNRAAKAFDELAFARLTTKRQPQAEESKKEQVKALREEEKKLLKEMEERYFSQDLEETLELIQNCRFPLQVLTKLTREFMKRFGEAKREKNLLDFTDMEHFTLKILIDQETGKMSQAARELSEKYEEVLVDEYQDSNFVQELLTKCVSGWVKNKNNIFMVGDVKQSIYRFRLAKPELFMEKYHTYTLEESKNQRIDLHKNFRSRKEVLESVNYLFYQIMGEDLGGVEYDSAAALYPGAYFPEGEDVNFVQTEVMLVEKDEIELLDDSEIQNEREIEALAIARRIQAMVGKDQIVDKKTGQYRPIGYGDIVVLLRTASGWSETFRDVFSSQGIPAYTASKTGYFSALEVQTVMNYLRICDNPLQDVPFTGVLHSPIGGFTTEEIAAIRCVCQEDHMYDSLKAYAQWEVGEKKLQKKISSFLNQLNVMRDMTAYTPVHTIILKVLEQTGYGNYAKALPDGGQRSANLAMLVEKAMDYEKTSYRGLFNFVRYIEKLKKYEVDYGEVNLSDAGCGAVQIMTIHKSKGLEFPVVFAAGMGKQFNLQDINAKLLIHPELGFGADAIDPETRITAGTLVKQVIRRQLLKENLGEELRVLYVALTRAKEKLILCGAIGKLEKWMEKLSRIIENEQVMLPFGTRIHGKCYWDYVLLALARHPAMKQLLAEYGVVTPQKVLSHQKAGFSISLITADQLIKEGILNEVETELLKERLLNWDHKKVYNEELREELKRRFEFFYGYAHLKEIPVKVSVSDLKKRKYSTFEEVEENILEREDFEAPVPEFMKEKEEIAFTGSARGTAYHRLMECLDYHYVSTEEEIEKQMKKLQEEKKLSTAEAKSISVQDVMRFCRSKLGKRMEKAALQRKLFREQPFVISKNASEIKQEWGESENVLVQGIIDAFFMEEDGIILVDYKTDRVGRIDGEQVLLERYKIQLSDYAEAIARMTGRPVKEKIIYSFTLNKEILVP